MQDKINPQPPPSVPPLGDRSPKTSPILFEKLFEYLENASLRDQLQVVLQVARSYQHEQMQRRHDSSQAPSLEKENPFATLWQDSVTNLETQKTVASHLQVLQISVKAKDEKKVEKTLRELILQLFDQDPLFAPAGLHENLEELAPPLFGEEKKQMLLRQALISLAQRLKKEQIPLDELLLILQTQTTKHAKAGSPTLFTSPAKQLLEAGKIEELLTQMINTGNPAELLPLIKSALKNSGLERALETLSQKANALQNPTQIFASFQKAVREKTAAHHVEKAAKAQVQSELSLLQQLIAFLQKYAANNPQLQQYLAQLAQIAKDYPNLTDQDLSSLTQIMNGIFQVEGQMAQNGQIPQAAQTQFLKQLEAAMNLLMQQNAQEMNQLNALLAEVQARVNLLDSTTNDLQVIEAFLQQLEQNPEAQSPSAIQRFMKAFGDLIKNYPNLSASQRQQLSQVFTQLGSLKNDLTGSFSEVAADALISSWVDEYYQSCFPNPATVSGLKNFIEQQMQMDKSVFSSNPFLANMYKFMQGDASQPNFPASGDLGYNYATVTGNTFAPNQDYWAWMAVPFSFTPDSIANALSGMDKVILSFEQAYNQATGQMQGLEDAINNLSNLSSMFQEAGLVANSMIYAGGSLPDDFANAILNHFMPGQEEYLQELAMLLFFSNYGAKMDNELLNDTMGWSNASNNYNFANWYNSMGGKATQQQVQQELQAEENQANSDLDKAEQALKDIEAKEQDIKNLEAEGKISPANAQKLLSQLDGQKASITQAAQNLQNMANQLQNAYNNVGPNGSLPAGIVSGLQAQENTVINGDPTNGGFGGLTTISTSLNNQQTEWTSMSTTQQLQLQERMTEIQQEWTVVSTAIQMLNQMYMAPAQGIYR